MRISKILMHKRIIEPEEIDVEKYDIIEAEKIDEADLDNDVNG